MSGLVPSIVAFGLLAFSASQIAPGRPGSVELTAERAAASNMLHSPQPAFFAAWFLAIAGVLNGIAHPVMAVRTGGYFPGRISSPLTGLAGLFLWRRLRSATSSSDARG